MPPFDRGAKERFLRILAQTGRVQSAADAAGIHRSTAFLHRKQDSEFAEKYTDALERFRDRLEAEMFRRGVEGWDEPVFYRGERATDGGEPAVIRKFSDRMLELLARGNMPDKYRENVKVDADVTQTGVLAVTGEAPDVDAWMEAFGGQKDSEGDEG